MIRIGRLLTLGLASASVLALVIFAVSFFVSEHKASAISNLGLDQSEYCTNGVSPCSWWYELSNTSNIVSTSMSVPLYLPTQPGGSTTVSVNYGNDGGGATGRICVEGNCGAGAPGPSSISEPASGFSYDANTGYWRAVLNANLISGNYRMFRMSVPSPGLIGYSSANTNHFAVGSTPRCDPPAIGTRTDGCGDYYNFHLPFAPSCATPSGSAQIQIFDGDNPFNLFGDYSSQPSAFTVQIVDTTTGANVGYSFSGGWGSGQTAAFTFNFTQFHKYQARFNGVYSNNVLQFKLPFDSINTKVSCPTGSITSTTTASCTAIKGYAYDRDNPALATSIYYYVNPPAGTPAVYPSRTYAPPITSGFRGPISANLANPPGTPAGVPANHGFSISVPSGVSTYNYNGDWAANTYWIYAKSSATANLTRIDTLTVPACGQVTCNASMTDFSGTIGVGASTTFKVWVSVSGATTKPPGATFAATITDSGGTTVQSYAPGVASPPPGVLPGNVTSTNMTFTPAAGGTYTAHWSYYGVNCTGPSVSAQYQPFFKVLGGDVAAGLTNDSGATPCVPLISGPGNTSIVRSWNFDNNPAGNYYGAGGQTGVFALAQISSFISGLNPLAIPTAATAVQTSLTSPHDVSFANSGAGVNTVSPAYGGNFGQYGYCLDDYVTTAQNRSSATSPGGASFTIVPGVTPSGTYKFAGAVTVSGTLGPDQRITVVSSGDIIMGGDLALLGGVAAPTNAPYFEALSATSIYVAPGVNYLFGFYDAQGGNFVTCANGTTETTDYDTCNNALTIDGAVSAKAVHFDRTFGNLNPVAGNPAAGQPAEVIRFSPALWIGALGECTSDPTLCQSNGYPYDSITALPPVL